MAVSGARLAKLRFATHAVGLLVISLGVAMLVRAFLGAEGDGARQWFVVAGGAAILLGCAQLTLFALFFKVESHSHRMYSQLLDLHDLAERQTQLLDRIADNTALSDSAKSLANRDRESDTLRSAIRVDVRTERWDAALSLVKGMEERFGFVEEAEVLRAEIHEARIATMRQKLSEATEMIKRRLEACDWAGAQREIARLRHALPDEPRVNALSQLYEQCRQERKEALLTSWNAAVQRNDVDTAIALLRDLDSYLTRGEARELEATARGVFKAKIAQLQMQFQFAVNEKRWRDALEIGMQITEEFPNSRMSQEVAQAMDGLRARAGLHGDVEITAGTHQAGAESK